MILYPNFYYKNVQSVDLDVLKKENIKGIILDVDNTLIDYKKVMPSLIKPWIERAKKEGFKVYILSNSNKKAKVSKVAEELNLNYTLCAKKPFSFGYKKVLKNLDLKAYECVAIGDQVFTDVIGANIMKIKSVYVEPISKKEYWYTKWKRPIEAIILNKYKKEVIK